MKKAILTATLALLVLCGADAQERSHFTMRYKYSQLFPIGFSVGGGVSDYDDIRLTFGMASPRTGNEWGSVLPTPEGTTIEQPQRPPEGGPTGGGPMQGGPQAEPSAPDVEINGTAFYAGVAWDHYIYPWLGFYGELGFTWLNALPDQSESSSAVGSDGPPPQRENIYFCIPVEVGVNLRYKALILSAGCSVHYKGYVGWTASIGFSI